MKPRTLILIGLIGLLSVLTLLSLFPGVALYAQTNTLSFRDAIVQRDANLRSGPGTTYAIAGRARTGQVITVIGCNSNCNWYQLESGVWIAASLVQPAATAERIEAFVVRVIDGDTIEVVIDAVNYRVQYIGVDAAEPGQPFGNETQAQNRALVEGQIVYLEKDISESDRYGRLLRYVWLADNTLVNQILVRQGYLRAVSYPPDVKYAQRFQQAQQAAQTEQLGLWMSQPPTPPAPSANTNANLRGGPATTYPIVGQVQTDQILTLTGRNNAGNWVQLSSGAWIAVSLVNNVPGDLPIVATPPSAAITTAPPPSVRLAEPVPLQEANCDPSYPDVCIPPAPPDLNCDDISYRRFRIVGADPHRFDGDGDGIGCER